MATVFEIDDIGTASFGHSLQHRAKVQSHSPGARLAPSIRLPSAIDDMHSSVPSFNVNRGSRESVRGEQVGGESSAMPLDDISWSLPIYPGMLLGLECYQSVTIQYLQLHGCA